MGRFETQQHRNLKLAKMQEYSVLFVVGKKLLGISKTASRQTKLLYDSKAMHPTEHAMGKCAFNCLVSSSS